MLVTQSIEIPLVLEVLNPCESAVLDDFTIGEMEALVLAANPTIQIITNLLPQDDVSKSLGNSDGYSYCGDRMFRITNMDFVGWENVLTYETTNGLSLWLQTDDEIYAADDVEVTIEAYLVEYPAVTQSSIFLTSILTCEVATLTVVTTDTQRYLIFKPSVPATITPNPFIIEPNCEKGVEYTIDVFNPGTGLYEPLPSFIQ